MTGSRCKLARPGITPRGNVDPEPHLAAALSEVDHGPRHVEIPPLIKRDRVALGKAQHVGNTLSVDQFIDIYFATHDFSLQVLTVS